MPLFRARLIGLGFDPERELVLSSCARTPPTRTTRSRGRRRARRRARATSRGSTRRVRRSARWRAAASRPSPAAAAVPAVRLPDGPGRAHLSRAGTDDAEPSGRRRRVARARGDARGRSAACRGRRTRRSSSSLRSTACEMLAIYKPRRGERPLWDFPHGHAVPPRGRGVRAVRGARLGHRARHRAARRPARHRRWCSASSTTIPRSTTSRCSRRTTTTLPPLRRVRRRDQQHRPQGRALPARPGRRRHLRHRPRRLRSTTQWKLRTVIWDFAGERLPAAAADDVCRVVDELARADRSHERLAPLLDDDELDAVARRAQVLLARGLPLPGDWHSTPWPLVYASRHLAWQPAIPWFHHARTRRLLALVDVDAVDGDDVAVLRVDDVLEAREVGDRVVLRAAHLRR